jgi:hypothetical protein
MGGFMRDLQPLLCIFAVLVGALVMTHGNSNPAAAGEPVPADRPIDPNRLHQPDELARLCERVRQRNREMEDRLHHLIHTETTTSQEFDRKGKETGNERVVERVRFEAGQEHRLIVRKESGGEDATPSSPQEERRPKSHAQFPLGTNEAPNWYRYKFEGLETLDGRQTIKLAYEPNQPLDGRFRGQVWIDATTYEPVRFFGAWAKLPPFVSEISMHLEWGPAENGFTQLRKSLVNTTGGISFFQKRYRIETVLADYREPRAEAHTAVPAP